MKPDIFKITREHQGTHPQTLLRILIRIVMQKVVSRKQQYPYLLPERPKETRAPCRKRTGDAVPRAENFGDMTTADYKVRNEACESRNNHRCAVVVQDLAIQRIQFFPCKTATSHETEMSLRKCLELSEKAKSHLYRQSFGIWQIL